MKREWLRNLRSVKLAPVGLYLALAAAVIAAGLYLIQRQWNLPLQICLGFIFIGLALFAILDPERVRVALTGRQARYGSNALVLTLAFLGIIAVLNYLVVVNSRVNPRRWDLTEDKQFTLAPETITTLASLQQPVKVEAFYSPNYPPDSTDQAKKLLDQYQYHGKGNFSYQFIDPISNPIKAQTAKLTQDGMIVLSLADRQERVTTATEADLTGALVKLLNPEKRTVYFLTGHGDYSIETTGDRSMTEIKSLLENKNYTVKTLNLLTSSQIPEDARLIVVAGPNKPLSPDEVKTLESYLAQGKALIVMEDSVVLTGFGDASDPLAEDLAQSWGVVLGQDFVFDTTSYQPTVAVGEPNSSHPITQKLATYLGLMPGARSVSIGKTPEAVTATTFLSTASQAWGETDLVNLMANQPAQYNAGVDLLGPVSLAVAATNTTTQARLVAFGNAAFASDRNYSVNANGDLFVNAVDWALGQEQLINLTPKKTTQRTLVPPQKVMMNLMMVGSVILVPGMILLAGVVVWIQRRKRG